MPKSKALKAVEQVLVREADRIGPALLESLKASYRKVAEDSVGELLEMAEDPERTGRFSRYDPWLDRVMEYVHFDQKEGIPKGVFSGSWEAVREHPELFKPYYWKADQAADESYENSRQSFISKNLSKFSEILGKREDLVSFDARVEVHRGVLTGPVVLRLSDVEVHGELSLKYVMRTNPRYTPYFQYPLVFTRAVVGGEEYRRPSEAQLAELISG